MKIYGDNALVFKTLNQEPGIIYGHDDVLMGDKQTTCRFTYFFFGNTRESMTTQPKLYLHIPKTVWSSFTGIMCSLKERSECLSQRQD